MRYYLAGKMTGLPNFGYDKFSLAAAALRARGLDVASPHEIDYKETPENPRGSLPYSEYIKGGLKLLLSCDAIALMSGWTHSKGASIEYNTAVACGIKVYFYNVTHDILVEDK